MNSQGVITLPYELYESILEKSISPDLSFVITNASYNGVCEQDDIKFVIEYVIKVNNDNLKPAPTSSSRLLVKLFSVKATVLRNIIRWSKSAAEQQVDGASIGSSLIISEGFYQLFATNVGRYTVRSEVSMPYSTLKNTGMDLSIPKSSNNSVVFRVPKVETNIKIFNSFPDVSADSAYMTKHGKELTDSTMVFAKLPGSEQQLRINWTVKEETKLPEKARPGPEKTNQVASVKPNVVVQQNILCSIGEGLFQMKTQFNYNIISGVISSFNIALNKNVNVLSVTGHAIKNWEVVDFEKSQHPNQTKMLQVSLDYGVEGNQTFTVTSEMTMTDTSGEATIQAMVCLGDEISRQRGFIGIEARTNVEISEVESESISLVDLQELPPTVHSMASYPILFGYKFLEQTHSLTLRVKKNLDCAVLVSICEEAHFVSTVSYSGKNLHQMILKIKNTKQQFLKIDVPFKYEVWSTLMDGIPVKPSFNDPFLLIPILKPGLSDSENSILVEIILLETEPALLSTSSGRYELVMPKIDLQLRAAFVTLYLPDGLKCSKFDGNLKKTNHFSSSPPSSITVASSEGQSIQQNYAKNNRRGFARNSSISHFEEVKSSAFLSTSSIKKKESTKSKPKAGLIPVHVDMPVTQNYFYFEQILLSGDKSLNIKFDYKYKKEM